jgi:hypothetical protein
MHRVTNHVLLRQRGLDLATTKLALFVGMFYSHNLAWLPMVIERTCLGIRLNPRVCFEGAQIKGLLFSKISQPKMGVWCNLGD